ncbi:MAG: hypothetical protein ACOYMF_02595 [Bacteroidales bacterium]
MNIQVGIYFEEYNINGLPAAGIRFINLVLKNCNMAEYEKPSRFQVTAVIFITIMAVVLWFGLITTPKSDKKQMTPVVVLTIAAVFGWSVINKSSKD